MSAGDAVLTVQVTLPDSLHILGVNELVAALPDNVDRRQVHVVADPGRSDRDNFRVQPLSPTLGTTDELRESYYLSTSQPMFILFISSHPVM